MFSVFHTLIVLSHDPDTILQSSNRTHKTAASCPLKKVIWRCCRKMVTMRYHWHTLSIILLTSFLSNQLCTSTQSWSTHTARFSYNDRFWCPKSSAFCHKIHLWLSHHQPRNQAQQTHVKLNSPELLSQYICVNAHVSLMFCWYHTASASCACIAGNTRAYLKTSDGL